MSKEFYKWFDSSPPAVDVIDWFTLYDEEENALRIFTKENIEPYKTPKN